MFEAYSVGVTLRLHNLISPQLALLSKEFAQLHASATSLKGALRNLGQDSAAMRSLGTATNTTGASLERASRNAQALEHHLVGVRTAAASIPHIQAVPGGARGGGAIGIGVGGGGRGPGGGPGTGAGNAGGGHGGRGGMHGGNIHLGPGGVGLGSIGMAAGDAFVPLAISAGMIYGGHALYESAKQLNTETARFKLFGLSDQINKEAEGFVKGMHVYGSTQIENMRMFREAQGIFRESGLNDSSALEGAKLAAPVLAKIAFASEALDDESKARLRTSSLAMLRWVEMSGGLKSAAEFNRLADFGWKMVQTSGGAVNWEQMRQFSATAGNAGRFLSLEGLAALEPLLGELKGGGAGTGLRTATNRITGVVKVPNQVAHMLVDNGLWDQSKIEWNKQGGIKQFNGNPFTGYNDYIKNPAQWYEKTMMPLYEKLKLNQEERGRENSMLFGGTGGRLFTLLELQLQASHHSVEGQKKALGVDASVDVAKKSLGGQEKEFVSAWTDFKTVLGTSALPAFTNLLVNGASFLRSINAFMESPGVKSFIQAYASGFETQKNMFGKIQEAYSTGFEWQKKLFGLSNGAGGGGGRGFVNPAPSSQPPVNANLYLTDAGKQAIATSTTKIQARHMGTGMSGGGIDSSVSLPQPGVTYTY